MNIHRRHFLQATTAFASLPFLGGVTGCRSDSTTPGNPAREFSNGGVSGGGARRPYKIGICDWDIYATGDPRSFAIAKELGFDGVEVSFSPEIDPSFTFPTTSVRPESRVLLYDLDVEYPLWKPENRRVFLEAAARESVEIPSFAMGMLNTVPLATTEYAEGWIADCIEAMADMKVKILLLPFFYDANIKDNIGDRNKAIEKLKRLAPLAKEKNVILGLETPLNAEEHLDMVERIGCDSAMVYYDVMNMHAMGYPVYDDLEVLLREKIVCQVHCKDDGALLGEGVINFPRVRDLLETYDYQGWLVAETYAFVVEGDWKEWLRADAAYLRRTFNEPR